MSTHTLPATLRTGLAMRLAAVALLVVVWQLVGATVASQSLPTPLEVVDELRLRVVSVDAWGHVAATSWRVAISTIAATLIGVAIGLAMGLDKRAEALLFPPMVVALGVPGPVYIIMAILILGLGWLPTTLALIASVVPFVANIVHEGVQSRDRRLDQMARVYRYSPSSYLRHVLIAQTVPTLFNGLRTAFGLSWKLVVLMEALSSSQGIGAQMVFYFRLLNPAVVVAYLAIFIAIMVLVDRLLFATAERHLLRWRTP